MTRTQKASFSTFNSVCGEPSSPPNSPHIVVVPPHSSTTNWPTWMRPSNPSTVLLEIVTNGPQVKEPTWLRKESKVFEIIAIAEFESVCRSQMLPHSGDAATIHSKTQHEHIYLNCCLQPASQGRNCSYSHHSRQKLSETK